MSLDHYDAPSGVYTSRIPPGMAAFRKVVSEHFGYTRSEIVRDASRCRSQGSEHCECGACDFFTYIIPKGRELFDWCVKNSNALGIQSVIFNRRVIGFGNPNERHYSGASPHTDHVHVGLNRWARANLTEAKIRALLPQKEDDLAQVPQNEWEQMKKDMADLKQDLAVLLVAITEKNPQIVKVVTGRATGSVMSGIYQTKEALMAHTNPTDPDEG